MKRNTNFLIGRDSASGTKKRVAKELEGRQARRGTIPYEQESFRGNALYSESFDPVDSVSDSNTKVPTVTVDGKDILLPQTVQKPETPDQTPVTTTRTWKRVFVTILRAHFLIFVTISGMWPPSTDRGPEGVVAAVILHETIISTLSHLPGPILKPLLGLVSHSGLTIIATLFGASVFGSFALYTLGCLLLTFVRNPVAPFRYLRAKYEQLMIFALRIEDALDTHHDRRVYDTKYKYKWLTPMMIEILIMGPQFVFLGSLDDNR